MFEDSSRKWELLIFIISSALAMIIRWDIIIPAFSSARVYPPCYRNECVLTKDTSNDQESEENQGTDQSQTPLLTLQPLNFTMQITHQVESSNPIGHLVPISDRASELVSRANISTTQVSINWRSQISYFLS